MSDFIKKEQLNGSQKVVVGDKYNDLVLRTLGRVYIQTGSKFTLLTEYLDKVTNEENNVKILTWTDSSELTESKYPGDGYFIYINSSKDLYITFEGGYVPLILSGTSGIDWEMLNKKFLSTTGGTVDNYVKVNGTVIANKAQFNDQVEINTVSPPLKVTSKELVKNFNAEYLQGYGPDDIPIKTRNESILGQWKFNNTTTFNDTARYSGKLVNADGFAPGFTGYGWMIDSESCTLTIDNLIVRKLMHVYELVVNKISATNGSLWVSDSAKIKSCEYIDETIQVDEEGNNILDGEGNPVYDHPLYEVRESDDFDTTSAYPDNESPFPSTETDQNGNKLINVYKTQFTGDFYHIVLDEDYCPFRLNDLLRCQRFDGTSIKYYDAIVTNILQSNEVIIRLSQSLNDTYNSITEETDEDGNVISSSINNKPQNQFEEVNGELIEVSTTTFDKSLTSPEEGDGLVRIGNTSIRDRMGAVYITSSDVGGPYIDIMNEVLTPNFNKITKYVEKGKNINHKCLKVRLGNLQGIYDPDFIQQPHGYGLYADNVFLKGKFMQVNSSGSTSPIPIYRGEWNKIDTFSKGDQVTWGGEIYSAIKMNTNQEPPNKTYWELVVSKGEDGKPGQDGTSASPVFYGEWDPSIKYPVSKIISSIVSIASDSGSNKQYFKTKAQNGFDGQEFIQGINPIKNGDIQEPWESFGGDFQSIATGLLLAEEANIAGFIFKDNVLISQQGKVNNIDATYESGIENFVPNLKLNGITGEISANKGEFNGDIKVGSNAGIYGADKIGNYTWGGLIPRFYSGKVTDGNFDSGYASAALEGDTTDIESYFVVNAEGKVICNNADMSGKITATEGEFGTFKVLKTGMVEQKGFTMITPTIITDENYEEYCSPEFATLQGEPGIDLIKTGEIIYNERPDGFIMLLPGWIPLTTNKIPLEKAISLVGKCISIYNYSTKAYSSIDIYFYDLNGKLQICMIDPGQCATFECYYYRYLSNSKYYSKIVWSCKILPAYFK